MSEFKVEDKIIMKKDCAPLKKGDVCTLQWGGGGGTDKNTLWANGECVHEEYWKKKKATHNPLRLKI